MIIVCFDHDNFIGNVVMGYLFPMWKEDIEKHIPTNCSHYDIVTEQEYEKKIRRDIWKNITLVV